MFRFCRWLRLSPRGRIVIEYNERKEQPWHMYMETEDGGFDFDITASDVHELISDVCDVVIDLEKPKRR